jgi:hypothetical protein
LGAVTRAVREPTEGKQAHADRMQLDYSDGLLISVVGCKDGHHVFTIGVDATIAQLRKAIAELHSDAAAFHRIIAKGKLLSKSLVRTGETAHGDDAYSKEEGELTAPLSSFGLCKGDKVKVVVTLQDEAEALKALVPEEDQRYLPFNEEIARERRRAQAAPTYARKASGSLNDFRYGFRSIEALEIDPNTNQPYTHPPPEEAHKVGIQERDTGRKRERGAS